MTGPWRNRDAAFSNSPLSHCPYLKPASAQHTHTNHATVNNTKESGRRISCCTLRRLSYLSINTTQTTISIIIITHYRRKCPWVILIYIPTSTLRSPPQRRLQTHMAQKARTRHTHHLRSILPRLWSENDLESRRGTDRIGDGR